MDPSKAWINQQIQPRRRRSRPRNITHHTVPKKRKIATGKNSDEQKTATEDHLGKQINQENPSLLDTLTTITQKMDLLKIKNKVAEMNQVVEQVNGLIQQINQINPTLMNKHRYEHHPYHPPQPYHPFIYKKEK